MHGESLQLDVLPVSLKVRGQRVVVLGDTTEAQRKVELLRQAGAEVDQRPHLPEEGAESWLQGAWLAVGASQDESENARLSAAAQAQGIPVNVVARPALSTFIFPSIINRHPITVAVSSGGASPVLTRKIRDQLESVLPAGLGRLAMFIHGLRERVREALPEIPQRRAFWEKIIDGHVGEQVLAGQTDAASRQVDTLLQHAEARKLGEAYLIGAGPGDPDLLTFRALRLLRQADVVLYDRLVSPRIIDMVRRDAELIYVGKARADHAVPQEEITRLLIEHARKGKRVARIKGGDPFIFGRGGEEIEGLAEAGIPFQVVPGITAAAGCGAYAGIPLTHRDHAQSVRFITGHLRDGSCDLNWEALAAPGQTLVFYMGLVSLPQISRGLTGAGVSPEMPVAVVSRGTLPDQQVVTGTLATIAQKVADAGVPGPAIVIVGTVVTLREKLNWRSA